MKHDMIWAYLVHLSENMWGDCATSYKAHTPLQIDDDVWRQVIDFLPAQGFNTVVIDVGDGIEYESHPEISIQGAWSKDKLKQELDHMRSIGLTPIPKLNFSAGHDAWLGIYSRMVSTPQYYRVCEDLIKEVAEVFGYPELFHLGMDEENAEMQKKCNFCCIRQQELWWHDLYFFFDCCQKVGARPWVWADPCWEERGHQEEYMQKMPKSALQSNWFYERVLRNNDGSFKDNRFEAYLQLDQAGFDQIPTVSSWDGVAKASNMLSTMEALKPELAQQRLKGYMTAPWVFMNKNSLYSLLNDAYSFGIAKKQVYPGEE